ncbi:phage tail sheath C-terminal domain-containing protein [Azospirillum sp. Sh1]|uniref:phage tail sheath C-terminal domain-containing protein n=1 Tax=Azospirillum sp. Sh1 TaxID=2607285 RepID=UPI0011EF02B1|nr:phage tail sheath C-terminal domain-containing protein [Azospirillum sp. Sh1]KAA0571064.1 phage tail protein [Azospirillum sp. Sh1]
MPEQFLHGVEVVEIDTGPRPIKTVKSAIIGLVGTAPIGAVNKPVLIAGSRKEAAANFGDDWSFSIPPALDNIFDQSGALVVVVNVFDPARHKTVEPAADHALLEGVFPLAHRWVSGVSVKTSEHGLLCVEGVDYTLDPTTGIVTPTRFGKLAGRSASWIGYTYADPSKVTPADIIGGTDPATGAYSGAMALLGAQSSLGVTPRILLAPGYTGQRIADGIAGITIANGGASYARPQVTIAGNGTGASAVAKVVGGEIVDIDIVKAGEGYSTATITVTDEAGAGATATATLASGGIASVTVTSGGSNYVTPAVAVSGDGSGAVLEAVTVDGKVTAVAVVNPGTGYTEATITISEAADGAGAVVTPIIGTVANPVVAEMLGIARRLRAVIFADGPDTTDEEAVAYRNDWGDRRVFVCDPSVLRLNPQTNNIERFPASPAFAGIQAWMDNEQGFWVSLSNKEIAGIVGTGRAIDFVLGDTNCRANYLNEHEVATIIREQGYRTWGNRTCASDPKWAFLCVVRTNDLILDSLQKAHLWAVDRNITRTYIADVTEGVNAYLRHLTKIGAITGGRCWADPELNTPDQIAQGKVYFDFDWGPTYPAEHITFRSSVNNGYLEEIFK